MAGMIKNLPACLAGVDIMIKRVEDAFVSQYRQVVWLTFCRILEQTPQFTGAAVANWRIGINAPDPTTFNQLGDAGPKKFGKARTAAGRATATSGALQRGDKPYIDFAKSQNASKIPQIHRGTKVYISNNVQGDTDKGRSSAYYMETMQDPAYWKVKLRGYNQPYENAVESLALMMHVFPMGKSDDHFHGGTDWMRYI